MQSVHYRDRGTYMIVQAVEIVKFYKNSPMNKMYTHTYTKCLPERSCLVIKLSGFEGNALSPVVMRRATQIIQDCKSTIKI